MKPEYILNSLELLRPWGIPVAGQSCLIVMWDDLPVLGNFLEEHPQFVPARIMIPDAQEKMPSKIVLGDRGVAPLSNMDDIGGLPQYEKIFMRPVSFLTTSLCRLILNKFGINHLWLGGSPSFGLRSPLPDFFRENKKDLLQVCAMLETAADRDVYMRRIKAIITGNSGYLPISDHVEYQHPFVRPEKGDVLIDGGVSDMVEAQKNFCADVGPEGRVHGFEPVPWMAESAGKTLAEFSQYTLHAAGLSDKSGTAYFDSLRDSSHVSGSQSEGENRVLCNLVSIDDFTAENNIDRVDCIKLDIEGSELAALHGAAQIIKRDLPKLIICLYHKPEDMFTIPLYIRKLSPAYRMHVSHSSSDFTDTILYAKAR